MIFKSTQIRGKGRGKNLGIPTINLQIPPQFQLEEGIYAVWVFIEGKSFKGAMHYGPVPVFNELRRSLEINLLETEESQIPNLALNQLTVRVVKKIRKIMNFKSPEEMMERIKKDLQEIDSALKKNP